MEFHESAAQNFNDKARQLVDTVQKIETPHEKRQRPPDLHVSAHLTQKDIVGEVELSLVDYRGTILARQFAHNDQRFGVSEEDYERLSRLAYDVQRTEVASVSLSVTYVETTLFEWLKLRYTEQTNLEFIAHLKQRTQKDVKRYTVFFPIANTTIEGVYEFCGAVVTTIGKSLLDEALAYTDSLDDKSQIEGVEKRVDRYRKKWQGYACLQFQVECEPGYATSVLLERAKQITELLNTCHVAKLVPDIKSTSRISGLEHVDAAGVILRNQAGRYIISERTLDLGSAYRWDIDAVSLDGYRRCGLDMLSNLYLKKRRSEFEEAVLSLAYLYAKSAFTNDPAEKLIYMLAALESILLRNETEPVSQNIAERMAFATERTLEKRKNLIRNIRGVYGARSRFLHHGQGLKDVEQLEEFFKYVWGFFVQVVVNSPKFSTKGEFITMLDDMKLS